MDNFTLTVKKVSKPFSDNYDRVLRFYTLVDKSGNVASLKSDKNMEMGKTYLCRAKPYHHESFNKYEKCKVTHFEGLRKIDLMA